jgi:hypothetical protein
MQKLGMQSERRDLQACLGSGVGEQTQHSPCTAQVLCKCSSVKERGAGG